jgi:hypothetical protein
MRLMNYARQTTALRMRIIHAVFQAFLPEKPHE